MTTPEKIKITNTMKEKINNIYEEIHIVKANIKKQINKEENENKLASLRRRVSIAKTKLQKHGLIKGTF